MLAPTTENWSAAEGFRDRHLSASEPRIFPGVVSRHQRRASTAKAEEVDGGGGGGLVMRKRVPSAGPSIGGVGKGAAGANDAVEESSDEEE
jgi:AMP deaminase